MKYGQHTAGYSIVEVLVAISILLLATVGPLTIAATALQSSQFARQQNIAFFLAQEGIELVFMARTEQGLAHINDIAGESSDAWVTETSQLFRCADANGCGLDFRDETIVDNRVNNCNVSEACRLHYDPSNSRARYTHVETASSLPTPYERAIYLEQLTDGSSGVRATVVVTWTPPTGGTERQVELQTFLYDIFNLN